MKKKLLFVDDEPAVLSGLEVTLRDFRKTWDMSFCNDSQEALARATDYEYDVIITDVRMPGMDGLELIRRLREAKGGATPIIVFTGNSESDLKRRALDLGATDLLNKPSTKEDLVSRIKSVLQIKEQQDQLKKYSMDLESLVAARTRELEHSRLEILWRLGRAAEYRDEVTGNHIVRVGLYSRLLAEALQLPSEQVESLFLAAPLHDVGKIGISDTILLKPGKLTDEEWVVIRRHCDIGAEILLGNTVGMQVYLETHAGQIAAVNPLLQAAALIAKTHHEKWNGGGYPLGLKGEEIPLEGRIVALADVYDALSSDRPYKKAFPEEKVFGILAADTGTHFDPQVHTAFERVVDTFREIRLKYCD